MKTCDRCGNEYEVFGATIVPDNSAVIYYCGDCWSELETVILCEKQRCCRESNGSPAACCQEETILDELPAEVTLTAEEYERLAPLTIVAGRLS